MTAPQLSVVIPAYNEAERLPRTLERVRQFLAGWGRSYEIIVVDDGSSDATAELATSASVSVIRLGHNRGKGHAVRRGMLAARGERRLMTDADLSTPIEELERLDARMNEGFDVVIGSRAMPGARIEVHQPWYRESAGRLFNQIARMVAVAGLQDTQCGFKLFTAVAAAAVFEVARLDGFCFDVEALFIARRRGFEICEIPVRWQNDAASRVTTLGGGVAFLDLARIRGHALMGHYEPSRRDG